MLGAHTDSPNLKLKPRGKLGTRSGCLQLDVQCYGGGLWHTWFDRDLSIAGRVFLRQIDGSVVQRLVKVAQPVLRVPNLCIHLQTAEERDAYVGKYGCVAWTDEALAAIAARRHIVEVGAGYGQWARALRAVGADVRASNRGDSKSPFALDPALTAARV